MNRPPFLAAGLLILTGCLSIPKVDQAAQAKRDVEQYGVRVIRPGMTQAEVETLLDPTSRWMATGGQFVPVWNYTRPVGISVRYDTFSFGSAKVVSCQIGGLTTISSDEVATFNDNQLLNMLEVGIPPSDVRNMIGDPTIAFENDPGMVVTVHPQPGVEVVYADGRLKSWRRVCVYEPADPSPAGK